MSTFLETLGLFLTGVGLAFWLGRVTRDKEVKGLKTARDFQKDRADAWRKRAGELIAERDRALDRVKKAEEIAVAKAFARATKKNSKR